MNADKFYQAAVPTPYTILGVRLRPFSIGHRILLNRIGSPFVTGDEQPNIGDIATAVLVCSKTYSEGVAFLDDARASQVISDWAMRVTNQHGLRRFLPSFFYKSIDVNEKARLLIEYLKEGSEVPGYRYEEKDTHSIDAPDEQFIKATLLTRTSLTEEEILNRPMALCVWDVLTIRAADGQVRFMETESISDAKRMANELQAKIRGRTNGA